MRQRDITAAVSAMLPMLLLLPLLAMLVDMLLLP